MKPLDWKELGRFNSVLLKLFSIIRDVFTRMKIGIEIIGWLADEGEEAFVKGLEFMGTAYHAAHPIEVIDEKSIMVNLDAPPKMPFQGPFSGIESQTGSGWVKVEKRSFGLYVDGRKVILYPPDKEVEIGKDHLKRLLGKAVLHPNIMDALMKHPQLIPEEWKEKHVYFWAVIFSRSENNLYVRFLFYGDEEWGSRESWLGDGFFGCSCSAVLS